MEYKEAIVLAMASSSDNPKKQNTKCEKEIKLKKKYSLLLCDAMSSIVVRFLNTIYNLLDVRLVNCKISVTFSASHVVM